MRQALRSGDGDAAHGRHRCGDRSCSGGIGALPVRALGVATALFGVFILVS